MYPMRQSLREAGPHSRAASASHLSNLQNEGVAQMAYGKKGHAKITGVKIGNHGKGGGGFKLHSDMKETHAKGHKQAPKAARKAM
jgi:hypothetical protein